MTIPNTWENKNVPKHQPSTCMYPSKIDSKPPWLPLIPTTTFLSSMRHFWTAPHAVERAKFPVFAIAFPQPQPHTLKKHVDFTQGWQGFFSNDMIIWPTMWPLQWCLLVYWPHKSIISFLRATHQSEIGVCFGKITYHKRGPHVVQTWWFDKPLWKTHQQTSTIQSRNGIILSP